MTANKLNGNWIVATWESNGIYITGDGRFFYEDGRELFKEYKDGLCYRAKGDAVRHYWKKLNKDKTTINKLIQWPSKGEEAKG